MDNLSPYDSRQFFCVARKRLGRGYLVDLFRKSEREVYRWGADASHCGQWRENPLEKIIELCRELDARGFEAAAAAPVHILAEALGLRVVDPAPLPEDVAPAEVLPQARGTVDAFFDALYHGRDTHADVSALLSRAVRGLEAAAACYQRRDTAPPMYFAASGAERVSPLAGRKRRPWWWPTWRR